MPLDVQQPQCHQSLVENLKTTTKGGKRGDAQGGICATAPMPPMPLCEALIPGRALKPPQKVCSPLMLPSSAIYISYFGLSEISYVTS